MSPRAIAAAARQAGLDAIAITDHNTARNASAFAIACQREGLLAFYGIEVCTIEEIHCLALFETPEAAAHFGDYLYPLLPDFPNRPEKLGDQPVLDDDENILELIPRYLGNATSVPYSRLPSLVAGHGGLFIPAHIDRPASGVLGRLGHLPPESGSILEITPHHIDDMQRRFGGDHALLTFSDAHDLPAIGSFHTLIDMEEFTLSALRDAIALRRLTLQKS